MFHLLVCELPQVRAIPVPPTRSMRHPTCALLHAPFLCCEVLKAGLYLIHFVTQGTHWINDALKQHHNSSSSQFLSVYYVPGTSWGKCSNVDTLPDLSRWGREVQRPRKATAPSGRARTQLWCLASKSMPSLTTTLTGQIRKDRGNLQQEATCGSCVGMVVKKELEPYLLSQTITKVFIETVLLFARCEAGASEKTGVCFDSEEDSQAAV